MPAQLLTIAPQFASADFDRTAAFYAQFGFAEMARYREGYLLLRRDEVELHFNQVGGDHDPAVCRNSAYARVLAIALLPKDLAGLDLPDQGIPRYVPPRLQPWGMIEAHIVDPDGNLLHLGAVPETVP